jgi:hypothetical protein
MKVVLLFTITIMIFILFLIPIICPFGVSTRMSNEAIGASYGFWYVMCFVLSLVWGHVVYRQGCWFFNK